MTYRYAINEKEQEESGCDKTPAPPAKQIRNALLPYLVHSSDKNLADAKYKQFESTYAIGSITKPLKLIPEPIMTTVKNNKEKSPARLIDINVKEQAKIKFAEYAKIYKDRSVTVPKKRQRPPLKLPPQLPQKFLEPIESSCELLDETNRSIKIAAESLDLRGLELGKGHVNTRNNE